MERFIWVCLGGAIGTGARYLATDWLLRVAGPALPWGTLAVNLIGSFLLGVLTQVSLTTDFLSPTTRIVLATGVVGGFTTYSAFNYETLALLQEGTWRLALANIGLTIGGCLIAGMLGLFSARLLTA